VKFERSKGGPRLVWWRWRGFHPRTLKEIVLGDSLELVCLEIHFNLITNKTIKARSGLLSCVQPPLRLDWHS